MTKRLCKKCGYERDADKEFYTNPAGYVFKICRYCDAERKANYKKRPAVLAQNNRRWVCEFDPTGTFAEAEFSEAEFDGTRLLGYWPAGSVWYNRQTGRYYHIEQRAVIFKNVASMGQFIRMAKKRLESE